MTIASVIDQILPGRQASWRAATIAVVLGWTLIGVARPDLIALGDIDFTQDHGLLSLDIAINRAFCDSPSKISTLIRVPYEARDQAALRTRPVKAILLEKAGTIDRYCLSVGSPIINNENSLMWIESWLFRTVPDLSLKGVAGWLHYLRLTALVFVSVVAMRVGAGLALAAGATAIALVVLGRLDALAVTAYPLDFVLLLTMAAIATLIAAGRMGGRPLVIVAIATGAFAALGANLRTSHTAIYVLLPLLGFVLSERTLSHRTLRAVGIRAVAVLLSFGMGYIAFEQLAITRHLPDGLTDSAHHTTWHSTVIGLAIPPNDVSRREDLEWSDDSAWRLAQRVDPSVRYIGPGYERILRDYYFNLWRTDASGMRAVYELKLRTAGVQMIDVLRNTPGRDSWWMWWLLRPASLVPHGGLVLLGYLVIAMAAAVSAWRGNAGAALLLMLALTAVIVDLESIVITTRYVAHYHAYLAFAALSGSVMVPLWLAGAAWRRVRPGFAPGR